MVRKKSHHFWHTIDLRNEMFIPVMAVVFVFFYHHEGCKRQVKLILTQQSNPTSDDPLIFKTFLCASSKDSALNRQPLPGPVDTVYSHVVTA
uniref:Uncharacterized protein n=1 Tax=Klebsiella pneumoniae TaxID=573 RepID=A0A8B0SUQ3_KLEPN|nr:hypothetical protein [Klebsiella pneumoniae]